MKPFILVVDDDDNIRMLLEFLLQKSYRVMVREDGLDAMAWLSAGNIPDLMIIDLEMPRLNGFDLLKQVRASGVFRHIPLIILSGYENPSVQQSCLDAGADAYLLKPFNPEVIHTTIHQLLTNHRIESVK
ncbi:MAG: response regulator [Bacteroidota bacterium]